MSNSIIVEIARLMSAGKNLEAILECDSAIQDIHSKHSDLHDLESRLLNLRCSAEILFDILCNPNKKFVGEFTIINPSVRKDKIIETSMDLIEQGDSILIDVKSVKEELVRRGIDLGVTRSGSVIGTILSGDVRFRRKDMGLFEYIGGGNPAL